MNFIQLTRRVNSEEEAVHFFQEYHILPSEMMCENGHQMTLEFGVKIRWGCRKRVCRVYKGIRVSNWLEGSKISLETAVHFIYAWAHEMTSVDFCQRELNMWSQAVVDWNNYTKQSGTARDFMDSYLAEYMWRTRLNGRDPFTVILQDIAEFWRPV